MFTQINAYSLSFFSRGNINSHIQHFQNHKCFNKERRLYIVYLDTSNEQSRRIVEKKPDSCQSCEQSIQNRVNPSIAIKKRPFPRPKGEGRSSSKKPLCTRRRLCHLSWHSYRQFASLSRINFTRSTLKKSSEND